MEQHYITPDQVGQKVFHLERIVDYPGEDYAYLEVILDQGDNQAEEKTIIYNYPPDFAEVIAALAKVTPLHMIGFEEGKLASAQSIWGFVCPCSFNKG